MRCARGKSPGKPYGLDVNSGSSRKVLELRKLLSSLDKRMASVPNSRVDGRPTVIASPSSTKATRRQQLVREGVSRRSKRTSKYAEVARSDNRTCKSERESQEGKENNH